jgi:hypothetical protein
MKRRAFLTVLVIVALVVPVATQAVAAESSGTQQLDVQVMYSDLLSIDVGSVYFGELLPPAARQHGFWLSVMDTTSEPWQVTAQGDDLRTYDYECIEVDEWGECLFWEQIPVASIAAENVTLHGPSLSDRVVGSEVTLSSTPQLFMTGAARTDDQYWIGWWEDDPLAALSVPAGTPGGYYQTMVTYTIMNTPQP